jgi:hypothetical protein
MRSETMLALLDEAWRGVERGGDAAVCIERVREALLGKTLVALDDYEVANLAALLAAINIAPLESDLSRCNTGDWVNQIRFKLPRVDFVPLKTVSELIS